MKPNPITPLVPKPTGGVQILIASGWKNDAR